MSANPHHHPVRRVTVLPLVYNRENEGTERLMILMRSNKAIHHGSWASLNVLAEDAKHARSGALLHLGHVSGLCLEWIALKDVALYLPMGREIPQAQCSSAATTAHKSSTWVHVVSPAEELKARGNGCKSCCSLDYNKVIRLWPRSLVSSVSIGERITPICMCVYVLVIQWYPTLCNPMDCRLPGSSVHEILQARILEWVIISSSRGSSWPRDQTLVSCIVGRFFTIQTTNSLVSRVKSIQSSPSQTQHSDLPRTQDSCVRLD